MKALKIAGLVFLGLFLLCVVGAVMGNRERIQARRAVAAPSAPPAPALAVEAARLWREYEANEVAADATYNGRTLRVTGTVGRIDKDVFGNIVIGLRSPNEFMPTRATLRASEAASAARLNKGVRVVVLCEGGGRVMGSPVLSDCVVAE